MHVHVGLSKAYTREANIVHSCKRFVKRACAALKTSGSNVWLPMNHYLLQIPQAYGRKQEDWLLLSQSREAKMKECNDWHVAALWEQNCKLADRIVLFCIIVHKIEYKCLPLFCSDFAVCSFSAYILVILCNFKPASPFLGHDLLFFFEYSN